MINAVIAIILWAVAWFFAYFVFVHVRRALIYRTIGRRSAAVADAFISLGFCVLFSIFAMILTQNLLKTIA